MKIGNKIILGFSGILLCVLIVGYFNVMHTKQISGLTRIELPMEQNLREVEVSLWETIHAANAFRVTGQEYYKDLYYKRIGDVNDFFEKYQGLTDTDEENMYIEKFNILWGKAQFAGNLLIELTEKQKKSEEDFFINVDEADDVLDFGVQMKWSPDDPNILAKEQAVREIEVSIWEAIHAGQQYVGLAGDIVRGEQRYLGQQIEVAKAGAKASLVKGDFKDLMERQFEDVAEFLAKYKALPLQTFENIAIQEFLGFWDKAVIAGRDVTSLYDQAEEQLNILFEKVDKADDIVDSKMQAFIQKRIEKEDRISKRSNTITIAILFLSVIGCISIGLFLKRSISRPVLKLMDAAIEIGRGKLDTPIYIDSKDEVGQLANSFKEMAKKLQQSRDQLISAKEYIDNIVRSMIDSLVVLSSNGNILSVNHATLELLGYIEDELVGQPISKIIEEDDEGVQKIFRGTGLSKLIKRGFIKDVETTYSTKEGSKIPVLLSGSVLYDRENKIQGIVCIAPDITDRKLAKKALQESEKKYRTILERIEDGYYEIDLGGNFTFFNDSMCKISGYSRDELMGMNNRQYTDEVYAKKIYQTFNKVYTTGKPDKSFHWPVIRKDSTKRIVDVSVSLRRDTEGEPIGFRGVVRDISDKKKMEAQLQQVTKMEAIATLAGGVAHEFNNALMGVLGTIELLKWDLPEDERRDEHFEAMYESGHRMSRLTDQLLAYAEGGKYQPRDLKLDDFIIETLPILQHDLRPEIRVETHFPKVSYIRADHAQMQMVLSAIVANSNEAIENEGLIRITAENKDVDEIFAKQHHDLKPGPYVCLTIEDDGKGMDEETKDGIFEPFFTTKFQGRGMGMAAVYGIIKSHDGAIMVESEPGKGTVVRIYLPAVEAEEEKEDMPEPVAELAMGEGTILVIEDEKQLVDLFRQILERLGYRVLVAETGKDAVELAKTFDGQIDLALLDIKLPDMDGGRVYPLIMDARPDMKVIVCSGYSIHGPAQDIIDAGAEGFIQKPFSIAPFAEKLKEVLEGK